MIIDGLKFTKEFVYISEKRPIKSCRSRKKFEPKKKLKLILLAESPPTNDENYFYKIKTKGNDILFNAIMWVVFGKKFNNKTTGLKELQRKGILLFDATEYAIAKLSDDQKLKILEAKKPDTLKKLKKIINNSKNKDKVKIILLCKNVFAVYASNPFIKTRLLNKKKIPFPMGRHKKTFYKKLKKLLKGV